MGHYDRLMGLSILDDDVVLHGDTDIKPCYKFTEAGLNANFSKSIRSYLGKNNPTPIQKYSIPAILKGVDVIGLSVTGSGKTVAFLIPIINKLLVASSTIKPSSADVLILAPTRELALQIKREAELIAKNTGIVTICVHGGLRNKQQKNKMEKSVAKGAHILVATPGKLITCLKSSVLKLDNLRVFIIDEADKMTEKDFIISINDIVKRIPQRSQVQFLMYSATTTLIMEQFAFKNAMKGNAQNLNKGGKEEKRWVIIEKGIVGRANEDIVQIILDVPELSKAEKLVEILQLHPLQTLIFTRTKVTALKIWTCLKEAGLDANYVSSDQVQSKRQTILEAFKQGEFNYLVATDVAARGIHIQGLPHVVNYHMPQHGNASERIRTYVHRIGRTGRMGTAGMSTSFFDQRLDNILGPELYLQLCALSQKVPEFLLQYEREATLVKNSVKKPRHRNSKKSAKPPITT